MTDNREMPPRTWNVRRAAGALLLLLLPVTGGCNVLGALSLWNYQFVDPMVPEKEIPAKFVLPEGSIALIVESGGDIDLGAPKLPDLVATQAVEHLRKNLPDRRFVPAETVRALRRRMPVRFHTMSPEEMGSRLRADTLIQVQLHDYRRGEPEEGYARTGNVQVMVRVLRAEDGAVLWPKENPWEVSPIAIGVYHPAQKEGQDARILDETAGRAADWVSKLFYTWRPPKRDIGDRPY